MLLFFVIICDIYIRKQIHLENNFIKFYIFCGIFSIPYIQLMAQFRIFPSSESRHSFVANYTSAVKFKIHILVLFCCIIIPLYVSESKYL